MGRSPFLICVIHSEMKSDGDVLDVLGGDGAVALALVLAQFLKRL